MIHSPANDPQKWKDFGGFSPLITLFSEVYPLSDEIKAIINKETFPLYIKKNKYLISPIDRNKYLFLICKGVVRGYIKDEDKEITTWICAENNVVGTIRNLYIEGYSEEYLQALEDLKLVVLPHSMSDYLYAHYPEANFIGRIIMEAYYRSAEERAFIARISSAEKRYKRFLVSFPSLVDRISLKYIASFLGIRLETLSRIRTTIAAEEHS